MVFLSGYLIINKERKEIKYYLSKFGSDRLSRVLRQSIIGAGRFHCRVRDGIVCCTSAIATKPTQVTQSSQLLYV